MKTNYAWVGNLRLAAISLSCAALLGACGGGGGSNDGATATSPPAGITAPPTIGAAGGTVSETSGATVVVPAGALATATTIRIANDSSGAPALPAELIAAGNMYAITPHGTTFAEPVDVRIPAPNVTLLPNQELKLAKAQPGGEWEVLGESTFSNGVLTARANSFSYFLPVKVTYLVPLVVIPPFAVTIAASCGLQDCNSATSPVNVTLTVTTNGGQLPSNCAASDANLRIGSGNSLTTEIARVPVSGAVFDRLITQQSPFARNYFTARLACNFSTGAVLATTQINFLLTPRYPEVNAVRVPAQLDVVAGTSANLDAMLDGGASKLVPDPSNKISSFTAPTLTNRAIIDWQRSDDAGASWRVVARSYQDEANPLPLGVGLPWRFWSIRHGFIAAATDHNALLRVIACYTPPDVAPPPCVTGSATRLNVLQASALPALVDSPRSVLVRTGQTASFSATASGTPTPTLQWQTRAANDNGAWINVANGIGATTNNYTTGALTLADNGRQFRILASNAIGSAASIAVTASVSDSDVAPGITTQPASLAVVAGSEALFAVAARGTEALSYQWRKNGVAITGANNPLLKLPAVGATDGASYAVVISNAAGTVTSQTAVLTVSAGVPPLLAPTIVTQPSAVSVPSGNTATFAAGVDGSGPFSFQWLKDGVAVAGETRAVFTLANVAAKNAGAYAVTVRNSVATVTSQAAGLDVTSSIFTPPPVAPSISTQPAAAIVNVGGSATLAVAASGSGPLAYQWSLEGAALAGSTGPILTLSNISALNTGNYSVTVSNSVGSITSSIAPVMLLGAPAIAQQVAAISTTAGNAATFSVTATGDSLRYLWMRDGLAIAGATASSYTIANPTIADNGAVFRVIVYNGAGIVLSQSVVLTVALVPTFSAQPADASTTVAGAATFSVTAQNAASLRWQRNGVDLIDGTDASGAVIAGAGGSTLSLTSLPAVWSGSLFRALATATGGGATVASNAATLTVNAAQVVSAAAAAGKLAAGPFHTCAIKADATVACWGHGSSGEVLPGSLSDQWAPQVVPGLANMTYVAVGYQESCAIDTAGVLSCWGGGRPINTLKDGSNVNLTGVKAVAMGYTHRCLIDNSTTVRCWGRNSGGQLGQGFAADPALDPYVAVPVIVQRYNGILTGVVSIAAGDFHTCALTASGEVVCWGTGAIGNGTTLATAAVVPAVTGAMTITSSSGHACAVIASSGIKCWGANGYSQLGNRNTTNQLFAVDVIDLPGLLNGVTAMAAESKSTCAIPASGRVVCWGAVAPASLNGNLTYSPTEKGNLSTRVTTIASGWAHSCALVADGSIECWGSNQFGQLGLQNLAAINTGGPTPPSTSVIGGAIFWK